MPINRREFSYGVATLALAAGCGALALPSLPAAAADNDTVPTAELMMKEALPDMVMGSAKAPVTIVEYASMTCPHCAHFDKETFPEIKKKYIDTGKVRYILREFPLDRVALAAFMLARCAGKNDPSRYFAMVDTLFRQQMTWAVPENHLPPLLDIAKQAGMTEDQFTTCLANQKLQDDINEVRQRAIKKFKVNSTPTFFINGKRYVGALEVGQMSKIIDAQLKTG